MAAAGRSPHGGDIMQMFEGPGEEALDGEQRALLTRAREAFRELEKLTKNVGLYGKTHQSVERFRARLHAAVTELIGQRRSIEFQIGPYDFTLYDQSVYQNPTPERNFVYRFYLDGIRHLIFHAGVTQDELDRFVDVLLTDWDDPALFEDDSVTLLWQQDFAHIQYVLIDNFDEDAREDDAHVYTVAGVVEMVRSAPELAPPTAPPVPPGRGGPPPLPPGVGGPHMRDRDGTKFRLDLRGAALTLDDLAQLSESPFAMDAGELTTLRTVIQTTGRETLEKFIEILFKVNLADEASTAERAGRIVGLFDRIAELLLEGGRIGELERLLRKVRLLTGPRGKPLPENQVAIDHIFAHWSNAAFVERIIGPLADPNYRFTPSVLAICGLLDARVVPALARAAGVVGTAEARAHLLALVAHRLPGHERAVAELLREVSPALAHDLVRILAPRVERTVVPFMVRAAMGNPDPTVRLEGLSLLPLDQLERHLTLLFPALHDPAKAVRSKAIHLIARVQSPDVHRRILQSIDDKAFTDFELDEKRRYFAAAALTGDANARFLELFQSGGLITRKGQDELRHCAAVALAIRLQRDAAALFDKELKRRIRSDVVAEAAEWAMQHMQCDRAERTRQLYDLFFRGVLVRGEGEVSA